MTSHIGRLAPALQGTMPPPIRYPLPTMVAALVLALFAWRGAGWINAVRHSLAARWQRTVEGPPMPASSAPQVVAGPMIRRALLLHDDTPVSPRPGASPTDRIARRSWVDVYDVWPLDGTPTHLRVGNRRPLGWVAVADALPWDTRLVVKTGNVPVPVVGWRERAVEIALWDRERPWSALAGRETMRLADLPPGSIGVLVAREELPALLSHSLAAGDDQARDRARLRAVLGRLLEPVSWTAAEVARARAALPAAVFERRAAGNPAERIAAANAELKADAEWGGHAFRFVPLEDLP
jgi:hypothetical protein